MGTVSLKASCELQGSRAAQSSSLLGISPFIEELGEHFSWTQQEGAFP